MTLSKTQNDSEKDIANTAISLAAYVYGSQAKKRDWLTENTTVFYVCHCDLQFVTKPVSYWRGSLCLFIPPSLLFSLSSSLPV